MEIFGNPIQQSDEAKAVSKQNKFARKFKYNPDVNYPMRAIPNGVLNKLLGIENLVISNAGKELSAKKTLIVGTIRMGYGHYRPAMAVASAAHHLGITPYWLDLLAYEDTAGAKIIRHLEGLYNLGSRWSQKSKLFNRYVWEPMTAEGFKKLSFNAADIKMCELMAPVYRNIPKDIPVIGTHTWPALAALHAGMKRVVYMIPDNWPLALHLAEGAVHAVQTPSVYMGYRTLKNMDRRRKTLSPIPAKDIRCVGHNIDHELVSNIEHDCGERIRRIDEKKPLRVLISIGGAGAQGALFKDIVAHLAPRVRDRGLTLFINAGDHKNVFDDMKAALERNGIHPSLHTDWEATRALANTALKRETPGAHLFHHADIYSAVYATNLLMRCTDILITKPSELAFYPVPKLMIQRVGGHEAWGAIRSSEVGDGTIECETTELSLQALDLMLDDRDLLRMYCENIMKQKKIGTYNGAYNVVKIAMEKK